MRFAYPVYLWALGLVPLMALYLYFFRERDLPSFQFSSLRKVSNITGAVAPVAGVRVLGLLRIVAVLFFVMAWARPQKGLRSEEMTTKATDIMMCLDVSRSMLSIDFKPKDRFQMAKNVMAEFVNGRRYDRIGLVVFAEYAITQCPLTLDRTAVLNILESLEVGVVPPDQTAIGVGLATSVNRLKNSQAKSKVIVLLTDGVNNAGTIDPLTAAKTGASFGMKIYTIGVGSPKGGDMPIDDPLLGRRYVRIKTDLDEDMLLKIATQTGAKYFRATSPEALKSIFAEIDALEKTDISIKEYVDYQELYVWFILAGLAALFIELFLNKTAYRTLP